MRSGTPSTPKAGPAGRADLQARRGRVMGYVWALTTGLMSPAQVSVFFTRA
jgi:hypothetical protein